MQQQPLSPCLFLGMTNYPTDLIIPKSLLEEGEIEGTTQETPSDLIRQIEAHIEAQEHEKAKDLLCQAFSKNIFDDTPYYLYAKTLFAEGLHKLAIQYLKEIPNPNEMARELLSSCKKRKREAKEEQTKLAAKRAEIAREEPEITTQSPSRNAYSSEPEEQASLPAEEDESTHPEKPPLEDRVAPLSSRQLCDYENNTLKSIVSTPTLKSVISIPSPEEREAISKQRFSRHKDSYSDWRKDSRSSRREKEKEKESSRESRSLKKRSAGSLGDSKKRRLASHTRFDEPPLSREEEVGLVSVIDTSRKRQLDQGSVSSSWSSQVSEEINVPKTPADVFPHLMAEAEFLANSLRDNGLSTEALITFRMGIPKLVSKDVIKDIPYRIVPLKWQKAKVYPIGWQNDKSNFCESLIAGFNLDEFFIQPRKTPMHNVPDRKNPTIPKNEEESRDFIKRNVSEANHKLDLLFRKDMCEYSDPAPYIVARLSPDHLLNRIRFKNQSIEVSNLQEVGTHNTSGGVFYYVYRWLWKGLQEKNHILPGYKDLISDAPILNALKSKGIVVKIFRTEDIARARSTGEHYEPITIADPSMKSTRTIRLLQTKLNDGSYHFDLLYPES